MKKLFLPILAIVFFASCGPHDDPPPPTKANFSITGYETALPATVNFINTSSNATTYLWSFGDGGTSTSPNPTHNYTLPGTFPLTLKVTGPYGTDSTCKLLTFDAPVASNKSSFNYFMDKCAGYPVNV